MAMTLLDMCNHAADKVGVDRVTALFGSSDEGARKLLSCARDEGEALVRRPEDGWVDMVRENTFVTVAAQPDYSLPADYKYLIDDTLWDRNNYWEMRGPMSPVQWQIYKSSVLGDTATTRRRWRLRNIDGTEKKFWIDPTPPDAGETLVFEYMSTSWCEKADGTAQAEWMADTDLPRLDEYLFRLGLIWRLEDRLGLDFATSLAEYEDQVEMALGRDTGGDILHLAGPRPVSLLTTCNVPDTGFGS